jgi:hypothetical protein
MKQTAMPFPTRDIPKLALIKQSLRSDYIDDPRQEVRQKLLAAGLAKKIFPGAHIAITAGSRGTAAFVELVSGIADAIRSAGGKPFIIPAMGSHGGSTPAGQAELLRRLGVSEKSVRAPVRATMDTLDLGRSKTGAVAHLDKFAAVADGIIVLGGVKAHPENKVGIASGLLKMTTVGLGKQVGAQQAHSHGLWDSVKAVPRITLARSKVLFGVAIVENAYRQPAIIEVAPGNYDAFRDMDVRLLKASVPYAAYIPFDKLDLLVVDQHGKDISGTGMDLNVIGKWRVEGGARKPDFLRIVPLSLTHASLGNGLGIGLADFTTQRFLKEYDPAATYVNLLTSTEPGAMNTKEGPMPLALASDREAIQVALWSTLTDGKPRACRIQSTKQLDEFWVSQALLPEVRTNPKLAILEKPRTLPFDSKGNLF